jgi:uncharacterized membrane protein (UPF0127 family)
MTVRRTTLLLVWLLLVSAACGRDGEPAVASATPAATPTASPFAVPTFDPSASLPPLGRGVVSFEGARAEVEVADDYYERRRGLMFREELAPDAGMLFVFQARSQGGFWMKNTLIPLQIAYMEAVGGDRVEIVDIVDMTPCRADPCRLYKPAAPYDTALEMNAGWFDDHGLEVGAEGTVDLE